MKIKLNEKPKWEYSVGDLLALYNGGVSFSVGVFYNEETKKYEPITEKKSSSEVVEFTINKKLFEKKYRSRFMSLYKEEEPTRQELKEDFDETFALFLNQRKFGLSNHLALVLNYYDPLYNYDRHEIYDEDSKTTYNGSETNSTDYTGSETNDTSYNGSESNEVAYSGSEKQDFKQSGVEQIANVGYNLDKTVGREIVSNEVTGYNSPTEFTDNTRSTTSFAGSDAVGTTNLTTTKTTGSDGLVNSSISAAAGANVSGRVNKTDIENLETHAFDGRVDRTTRAFDNRKDVGTRSFNDRVDSATRSFNDRNDTTTLSFNDRNDRTERKTNNHLFGNIGVTTSMALVLEQYQLNELYDFAEKNIADFMNEYSIVM